MASQIEFQFQTYQCLESETSVAAVLAADFLQSVKRFLTILTESLTVNRMRPLVKNIVMHWILSPFGAIWFVIML